MKSKIFFLMIFSLTKSTVLYPVHANVNLIPNPWTSITTPITLSVAGNYYLTQDVAGNITIAANGVTLDLNGHAAQGIAISGFNDIQVYNGSIANSTDTAITMTNCVNISLHDLDINNGVRGVYVLTSTSIHMQDCILRGNTGHVLTFDGCSNSTLNSITAEYNRPGVGGNPQVLFVNNSADIFCDRIYINNNSFTNNVANNGVSFATSSNCSLTNSTINNNAGFMRRGINISVCSNIFFDLVTIQNNAFQIPAGISVQMILLTGCSNIYFSRCILSNNEVADGTTFVGFNNATNTSVTYDGCQVNNNFTTNATTPTSATMYNFVGGSGHLLRNCTAKANGNTNITTVTGFDFLGSAGTIVLEDCIASTNSAGTTCTGFKCEGSSANISLIGCQSSNNTSASLAVGFSSTGSATAIVYDSCIALANVGTNTGIGFHIDTAQQVTIKNSQALVNTAPTTGFAHGFLFNAALQTVANNNIAVKNLNGNLTFGIGFQILDGTTSLFSNEAEGHSLNFSTNGGGIPLTTYTISTNSFSPTPVTFNNISIV